MKKLERREVNQERAVRAWASCLVSGSGSAFTVRKQFSEELTALLATVRERALEEAALVSLARRITPEKANSEMRTNWFQERTAVAKAIRALREPKGGGK